MPNAVFVGWAVIAILPILFAIVFKNYHNYWLGHQRAYQRAQLFLNSNACLDSGMKAALAEFNLCDAALRITDVPPTLAAWYDVVDDVNLCGRGRCLQLYSDLTTKLPLLFMVTVMGAAGMYYCFSEFRYRQGVMHNSLPYARALANGNNVGRR